MTRQMAFVLSDMRSGSTLLDQLIGAHPDVMSLGELHWLPAYVTQDRSIYNPNHELVCTCGRSVNECELWSQVARTIRSTARFAAPSTNLSQQPKATLLERFPRAFRIGFCKTVFVREPRWSRTPWHSRSVYLKCLVGVTWWTLPSRRFRFRAVYELTPPRETRGLILTRDYRAVVHSKMKRGHTLESAAKGWRSKMGADRGANRRPAP